ncbi:MAG: hypothetical protein LUC83_11480 [Clostridiales bacterium]|nr:hypothetical protein [Clostridiales bacterium]
MNFGVACEAGTPIYISNSYTRKRIEEPAKQAGIAHGERRAGNRNIYHIRRSESESRRIKITAHQNHGASESRRIGNTVHQNHGANRIMKQEKNEAFEKTSLFSCRSRFAVLQWERFQSG